MVSSKDTISDLDPEIKSYRLLIRPAKLVLRKTGRLVPYRLSRFRDFIFQLFGIIVVVGVEVESSRNLVSRGTTSVNESPTIR